jgi:hypothetical protein
MKHFLKNPVAPTVKFFCYCNFDAKDGVFYALYKNNFNNFAMKTFLQGALALILCFFAATQTNAQDVKQPSTDPISLQYPQVEGEPFVIVRGDHVRRVDFIDSRGESAFSWKHHNGTGLYKVIVRLGSLPKDIYRVVAYYGDNKSNTFIVRTDDNVF